MTRNYPVTSPLNSRKLSGLHSLISLFALEGISQCEIMGWLRGVGGAFLFVLVAAGTNIHAATYDGANYAFSPISDGSNGFPRFNFPRGIVLAPDGNFYVADSANKVIRKITPAGVVSTFAGQPGGSDNVDGVGSAARFISPTGLACDTAGNLYVADPVAQTIRKISPAAVVSTVAGLSQNSGSSDGTGSAARFNQPYGVAVDSVGNLYVADAGNNTIRKITAAGVVTTLAGSPGTQGSTDGSGSSAHFSAPSAVAVGGSGTIYVADVGNFTLRKITQAGTVSTLAGVAGAFGVADGAGSSARFEGLWGLTTDGSGNLLLGDYSRIRRITADGVVTTVPARPSVYPVSGPKVPVQDVAYVEGLAVDNAGNIFVTSDETQTIEKVSADGLCTTLAGVPGRAGYNDGAGTMLPLNLGESVAVDGSNNVYFADSGYGIIRKLTPDGTLTTLAGAAGVSGYVDGVGTAAVFGELGKIIVARDGNIYATDYPNHVVRKITPDGIVSTFAGNGTTGYLEGPVDSVFFFGPQSLAADSHGNIYVADAHTDILGTSCVIRKISADGYVTIVAGNFGMGDNSLDPLIYPHFVSVYGLAVDSADNLYIGDNWNRRILKHGADGTNTFVSTADGTQVYCNPMDLQCDGAGNLYIVDQFGKGAVNFVIHKLTHDGLLKTVIDSVDNEPFGDFNWCMLYGVAVGQDASIYCITNHGTSSYPRDWVIRGRPMGAPTIAGDPVDSAAVVGFAASFTIDAGATLNPTYRWQCSIVGGTSWTDLTDNLIYAGTQSATLAIAAVDSTMVGNQYRCMVVNGYGSATSHAASLAARPSVPDTTRWIGRTAPFGPDLRGIAWSGTQFIAVGQYGDILTSPDGVGWTAQQLTGPSSSTFEYPIYFRGVACGGGRIVAVGDSGLICTSLDGITWKIVPSGYSAILTSVTWGNSRFVAVGTGGACCSSDGTSWSPVASGGYSVTYGGGRFVAVGPYTITVSNDGVHWVRSYNGPDEYDAVVWDGREFVAIGGLLTQSVLFSADGSNWTRSSFAYGPGTMGLVWGGGQYVATEFSGAILTSPDGANWLTETIGNGRSLNGAAWNGRRFVVVGDAGTILTSAEGQMPAITGDVASVSVVQGDLANFRVSANGEPAFSYQWEVSTDGGNNWSAVNNGGSNPDYDGATSSVLTVASAQLGMDGWQYRCVITNPIGNAVSHPGALTVTVTAILPAFPGQPGDQTATVGLPVTLSAMVSGSPSPACQWQVSADGAHSWTDLADTPPYTGTATEHLVVNSPTTTLNGYRYRCVATNRAGNQISNAATLSVLKRTVPLTLRDLSWTYDGTPHSPTPVTAPPGLGVEFTYNGISTAPVNAGSYSVVGNINDANCQGSATATMLIGKASLTAKADDQTRAQGSLNPLLTVSYSGFINGDSSAVVDTPPTPSTLATPSSPIGTYAITLSGGSSQDYALTLLPGILTVSCPAPATGVPKGVIATEFDAAWIAIPGASGYYLDASADRSFASFLSGYQNLDVGNVTSVALTGLNSATTYYYRVRGYGSTGVGPSSATATVVTTTPAVIAAPLTVTTLAGQVLAEGGADGIGPAARFYYPSAVVADNAGNLYVADTDNHTIRKIAVSTGGVTTLAGATGVSGSVDGMGTAARFDNPSGVAADASGNVYVADTLNNTLRRVSASGSVTTLVGVAGVAGSADGVGSGALFQGPQGLAIDGSGDLFVADTNNHTIRKVAVTTGTVTTVAGTAGISGASDGIGTAALFSFPSGVAVDASGNLFVADTENHTIREIQSSGFVSTVAGLAGYSGGADGVGTAARFDGPSAIVADVSGNLYVADTDNFTIRKIVVSTGAVSTLAGLAGTSGSADGLGSAVRFFGPSGIAMDSSSNLYIADTNNNTIRIGQLAAGPLIQTQPQSQTVTAGSSVQFSVTASGRPAPTYQWFFGSAAIVGATSSSFSILNPQAANAGSYTVAITNSVGSVTSDAATLTVNATNPPPSGGGGSSDGGGGGGGGGGAPSWWAIAALMVATLYRISAMRRGHRRRFG